MRPPPAPVAEPRVVKESAPADPLAEAWRTASRDLEQGRARDARHGLAQVLRLSPAHAAARQALIALLLEWGDKAEALCLLEEGRGLHPADPWYPRSQAQLLLQEGLPVRAANALKPALGKDSPAEDWALYASISAKLARHEEAARAWREALRGHPGAGVWWIGLGVALDQLGQKPEAAQAFQQALQGRLPQELREFAAARAAESQ